MKAFLYKTRAFQSAPETAVIMSSFHVCLSWEMQLVWDYTKSLSTTSVKIALMITDLGILFFSLSSSLSQDSSWCVCGLAQSFVSALFSVWACKTQQQWWNWSLAVSCEITTYHKGWISVALLMNSDCLWHVVNLTNVSLKKWNHYSKEPFNFKREFQSELSECSLLS